MYIFTDSFFILMSPDSRKMHWADCLWKVKLKDAKDLWWCEYQIPCDLLSERTCLFTTPEDVRFDRLQHMETRLDSLRQMKTQVLMVYDEWGRKM